MLRTLQLLSLLAALSPALASHGLAAQRGTAPVAMARPMVDTTALARLTFRNVGPANMMGRSTDIEGVPG
ncbi:MAG: hypothetical protein ACKORK_04225, partial [Gemmatimonadota bacterium]